MTWAFVTLENLCVCDEVVASAMERCAPLLLAKAVKSGDADNLTANMVMDWIF